MINWEQVMAILFLNKPMKSTKHDDNDMYMYMV